MTNMYTIDRLLVILAGMLFAVLNVKSGTVPVSNAKKMTVSDLMIVSNNSLGFVDYFKKLELDQRCNMPILSIYEYKKFENDNNITPCLCTIIYNMTQELNTILENVSETAKINISSYQSNNLALYEVWKNVSIKSSSLKLFMEPLKDEEKWRNICHSIENDNEVTRYCKFLNFEIMLWHNILPKPKEPKENNVDNILKNVIEKISSVKTIETVGIDGNEMDPVSDDTSQLNNINNDDELAEKNNNKEEDIIGEEIQNKPIDGGVLNPSKLKDNSKSNNDYANPEDVTLVDSEAKKETQSRFNQKNTFTNHDFDDVEDSHFLFYFGIMTVFSLLFYLALYNKKKIIALLIEGRRNTNHRRRPNTASYSKVETDDGTTVF
ncbi:uncharacterized protein LOC112687485 isoform X2 [Sipha flava]|uniref:Uncharacterized protein LOC112687485 isoform X2 n=1 Tax=Sipha flava TaxID=143950 RepID=A0A8B8FZN1_9HEMI|nr:uncharacterized protein LOC112687485 isoform X2 [Sipha flava]